MIENFEMKINRLFSELDASFDPTTFVLNSKATKILSEIEQMQQSCNHNFINGKCSICRLEASND